jgi:hypothetical protein
VTKLIAWALAAVSLCLVHPTIARADYVYTYTGGSYNFNGQGCSPISLCPIPAGTTGLTITIDTPTALIASTTYNNASAFAGQSITMKVTDGYYTATCTGTFSGCNSASPNMLIGATLSTDSSGQIVGWSVLAYTTPALSGLGQNNNTAVNLYSNSTPGGIFGQTNLYDYTVVGAGCCGDYGSTVAGTWTQSVTAVPLPASAWLMLSGLVGIGVGVRQRRAA